MIFSAKTPHVVTTELSWISIDLAKVLLIFENALSANHFTYPKEIFRKSSTASIQNC